MERMQSYKKIKCRKSSAGLAVIRTRLDAPWGISEGVSADESHATAVCALVSVRKAHGSGSF